SPRKWVEKQRKGAAFPHVGRPSRGFVQARTSIPRQSEAATIFAKCSTESSFAGNLKFAIGDQDIRACDVSDSFGHRLCRPASLAAKPAGLGKCSVALRHAHE